jgi:pimeloyl-ACP methyl ester carboxylesterase
MASARFRVTIPILCSCSLALVFSTLLLPQEKGNAPKGKAKGKGNNLIRPLADLEKDLKGKLERIKVHGRSLEGNLEGDSADRDVFVYLPPSYQNEPNRRYPVVYTLHGYGLHAEQWVGFANFASLEKDVAAGTAKEMILVSPDAFSLQNGSFYSSSPTTGDWETFLATELVGYIDSHYRSLANRASRGLVGHSMGGYGTFRLGMKHPEVFSSLFSMSACCMLDTAEVTPALAQLEAIKTKEEAAEVPFGQKSPLARAAAWSADPQNPPLFFDLPVKDGKPQPVIAAKWMANDEGDSDERRSSGWIAADQSRHGRSFDQSRRCAHVRNVRGRSQRPGGDELRNQGAAVLLRSTRFQPGGEGMTQWRDFLAAHINVLAG